MEINSNLNPGGLRQSSASTPSARAPLPVRDQVAFPAAAGLNQALQQTPDNRAAIVERAQMLAADPSYPPLETINRIANLLAIHLSKAEE